MIDTNKPVEGASYNGVPLTLVGQGGGMENPMTTQGDLIVGGSNGTPTRLGIGQAGKFLKVNSSGTGYEFGDAGGGGGGGSTRYDHHITMYIMYENGDASGQANCVITTNSSTEMGYDEILGYMQDNELSGGIGILATGCLDNWYGGTGTHGGPITRIDDTTDGAHLSIVYCQFSYNTGGWGESDITIAKDESGVNPPGGLVVHYWADIIDTVVAIP